MAEEGIFYFSSFIYVLYLYFNPSIHSQLSAGLSPRQGLLWQILVYITVILFKTKFMFQHILPTWIYTSPLHTLPLTCNNKCQNDVLHSYTSSGHSCLTRAVSGLWVKNKVNDFVCKEQQQSESAAGNETCSLELNLCPELIYIHNLANCTATSCGHNAEIQFALEKMCCLE